MINKHPTIAGIMNIIHNIDPLKINFENSKTTYPSTFYFPSITRESVEIYMCSESMCKESEFNKKSE